MRPLQISADTAQKLAKQLNVPVEHLMHMPQHILLQKLAELAKSGDAEPGTPPEAANGNNAKPERDGQ